MLRMAQPCELASVRSGKPSIPERAPRTKELSSALERIEGDHPGLRFERPSHVLVSTPNGRAGELCVPHVCTRGFSRSSFFRLGDDVFFSKPELAFIQMATRIRNEVSLLELGWELCGSYQTRRTGASVGYDVEPLTSVRALRDYVACNSSLGGALLVGCGCAASHLELSAGVQRTPVLLAKSGRIRKPQNGLVEGCEARRFQYLVDQAFCDSVVPVFQDGCLRLP